MIEIEKYPCNDRNEAVKRERFWYEELKGTLNSRFPTRTKKEYRQDNKDTIKGIMKEYYEDNKEKLLLKAKEYSEKNKEKIKERQTKRVICLCGSEFNYSNTSNHNRSVKHRQYIESSTV